MNVLGSASSQRKLKGMDRERKVSNTISEKNLQKFVNAEMNQVVALIPLEVPDLTMAINWITLLDAEIGVHSGCQK